jgi:hypothetical protein
MDHVMIDHLMMDRLMMDHRDIRALVARPSGKAKP